MKKKIVPAIIVILLIVCCVIPLGFWAFSAANTKPTCTIIEYVGENKISDYKAFSINDIVEISFEANSVKTIFMGKSTELFGTGRDYKCPADLSELKIDTSKVTKTGQKYEIIYKKLSDYTAYIGARIGGKEYYLSNYSAPKLE
jgi:hypothetical protein